MGKEISLKAARVVNFLEERFPNAKCSLDYKDHFSLLVAILLSAQSLDKAVNKITPLLFAKYPSSSFLTNASLIEVEEILHPLGLYKNKAKNIIALSKVINEKYHGEVPSKYDDLVSLPGVGNKTASVYLLEAFKLPYLPVDTHIARIAYRLQFSEKGDSPLIIQRKLERTFPQDKWIFLHHALIQFGREICSSKKPLCSSCPMKDFCLYQNKGA